MKLSRRSLLAALGCITITPAKAWFRGNSISPIFLVLDTASSTPSLVYNFRTMPIAGDVIEWFDGAVSLGTHTFTQTDIDNGTFTGSLSPLGVGSHTITVKQRRSPMSSTSNSVSFTV